MNNGWHQIGDKIEHNNEIDLEYVWNGTSIIIYIYINDFYQELCFATLNINENALLI